VNRRSRSPLSQRQDDLQPNSARGTLTQPASTLIPSTSRTALPGSQIPHLVRQRQAGITDPQPASALLHSTLRTASLAPTASQIPRPVRQREADCDSHPPDSVNSTRVTQPASALQISTLLEVEHTHSQIPRPAIAHTPSPPRRQISVEEVVVEPDIVSDVTITPPPLQNEEGMSNIQQNILPRRSGFERRMPPAQPSLEESNSDSEESANSTFDIDAMNRDSEVTSGSETDVYEPMEVVVSVLPEPGSRSRPSLRKGSTQRSSSVPSKDRMADRKKALNIC
jgi:hypothetical protein